MIGAAEASSIARDTNNIRFDRTAYLFIAPPPCAGAFARLTRVKAFRSKRCAGKQEPRFRATRLRRRGPASHKTYNNRIAIVAIRQRDTAFALHGHNKSAPNAGWGRGLLDYAGPTTQVVATSFGKSCKGS